MTNEPVVIEQTYNRAITDVWNAITNVNQMREWYFTQIQDFQPQVGFETYFDVECDGDTYRHMWKVVEVDENSKISYDWSYEGISGQSNVVWELESTSGGTKLTLTHSGGETFPQDNPLFSRESGIAGWTYFIQQNLVAYLDDQS